jgi:EmrB/QacA subfamily drug resistance transporter
MNEMSSNPFPPTAAPDPSRSDFSTATSEAVERVLMDDEPPPVPVGRLAPLIIGSALFMQILDATVIANALPTMAKSLHEDPLTLNLAITSYLLAAAVFLPVSSWVADRFGAKTVFRIAISLFAFSSLLCGLAQSLPELVGARMLQGMAGAMMVPVGRLVLLRMTPKNELIATMSYLTLPAMVGPMIGPPIGGFIVTHWSWRWIFLMNIPIGIVGVVLVSLFIIDVRERAVPPLDWRGFILTGFGFAGLVYGFDNLGRGSLPVSVVAALLLGGAFCLGVYCLHARRAPHAILDLSLLRVQTFAASVIGGGFLRMATGAMPFLLAILLQVCFGLDAFAAGMTTFAGSVAAFAMRTASARIVGHFGFKSILVVNSIITALSLMIYGLFTATTPYIWVVGTLLIGGVFRTLQFNALGALAYADIDQERMSGASSLSSMGQQLSQSIGIGMAAMLLSAIRGWRHSAGLTTADVSTTFLILGLATLLGFPLFLALPRDAGAEVSGRRTRESSVAAMIGPED